METHPAAHIGARPVMLVMWYDTGMARKLRIAWSVTCGIVCLLPIALWVRSNWYLDEIWFSIPSNRQLGFLSAENCGSVAIHYLDLNPSSKIEGYSCQVLQNDEFTLKLLRPTFFLGFSLVRTHDRGTYFLNVPYWFVVLIPGSIATCPWIFRFRFSVRTLLVATTLVAVVLGLIVWATR
jgi:hypothetical protein